VREEESIKEIFDKFEDKFFYLRPDGSLLQTGAGDTLDYILNYMTEFDDKPKISNEELSTEGMMSFKTDDMRDIFIDTLTPVYSGLDLKDWYHMDRNGGVFKVTGDDDRRKVLAMRPYTTKDGYSEYVLTDNHGKKKHIQGQRLMAFTYLGDPGTEVVMEVNHKDGDRSNNAEDNLEWMTKSENIKHSFDVLNKQIHNKGKKRQEDGTYK